MRMWPPKPPIKDSYKGKKPSDRRPESRTAMFFQKQLTTDIIGDPTRNRKDEWEQAQYPRLSAAAVYADSGLTNNPAGRRIASNTQAKLFRYPSKFPRQL